MKALYGLAQSDYDALLRQQKDRCAVCRMRFTRTPHIDHCHKTKKIRGLLCGRCNPAIGLFLDKPRLLIRAATYLGASRAKAIMETLA